MWRGCGLIIMMSDVRPRSRRRGFRPFRCRVTMPVKCSQLKPRSHRQQCRSNIVECYKPNDSFDNVECCYDIVAAFDNNVAVSATFWQQCCRFWQQYRTKFRPIDKAETNSTCSVCFDFVERTKFYNKLVRQTLLPFLATKSNVASTKSNVASTLLLVWTWLSVGDHRL